MEKQKQALLYFVVIFLAIGICSGFVKIFTFKDPVKEEEKPLPEVTEDLAKTLYGFIPKQNELRVNTMYSKLYTKESNINPRVKLSIVYQYIAVNNAITIEEVTESEKSSLNLNGTPIKKIKETVFQDRFKLIYGPKAKYESMSFDISYTLSGQFQNEYVYICEKKAPPEATNTIIYQKMLSYTVADSGRTIIIYDYYLRCNKDTKKCFNDEKEETQNTNITYSKDLDLTNNKYLKKYEHIFNYDDKTQKYYWFSSQESKN